jgi:hypothetical protein
MYTVASPLEVGEQKVSEVIVRRPVILGNGMGHLFFLIHLIFGKRIIKEIDRNVCFNCEEYKKSQR